MLERITGYERQVRRQRIGFYASEILIVLLSAAIPAGAAAGASAGFAGVLGALVVVAVGMRQLFRWGENWIRSSGSLVALQGEVVLWNTGAGPYQDPAEAGPVLAARTEALVLTETMDWASTRRAAMAAAEAAATASHQQLTQQQLQPQSPPPPAGTQN